MYGFGLWEVFFGKIFNGSGEARVCLIIGSVHDKFKCEISGRVTNRVTNRFYTTKRQGDVRDGGGDFRDWCWKFV